MGSSPVTATTHPLHEHLSADREGAIERVVRALDAELPRLAPIAAGHRFLVALSGGPDSTALLLAAAQLAPLRGWSLLAAHVDHRLDAGSSARAEGARALAGELGVPCQVLASPDSGALLRAARRRSGPEAAARDLRYRLLEEHRAAVGADWLLTAHHADDQIETVLLRLLAGTGIAGLAGIPERRGHLLRPLLRHRRAELADAVAAAGLRPLDDPTNRDLAVPRNRIRHLLLRRLPAADATRALALAASAAGSRTAIERRIASAAPVLPGPCGPRLALRDLVALPAELRPWALVALHAAHGRPYPPRAVAFAELARQLAAGGGDLSCDCGGGWRWMAREGFLELAAPQPANAQFAYTLTVPGGVEIREAGTTFRLTRQPVAPWMRRGSGWRAALDLALRPGDVVTIRTRRPGDRLRPLGCTGERKLKDLLIDRKVPRQARESLPLLLVGERVAWVPGVTVHHDLRLRPESREAWVAELLPHAAGARSRFPAAWGSGAEETR
jgi:tRNA(Ile)-lysidine synthase